MFKNRGIILVSTLVLMCLTQGLLAVQYAVVSESFNVPPGGTLKVDVVGADINIRGEQNSVTVNVKGLQEEYKQWLVISQEAYGVLVKFDPKKNIRNHDSIMFAIGVPREFNIEAETSGGDITIQTEVLGNVTADTSGGDITFQEKITGLLKAETSGGDIEIEDVEGELNASTSGGDIEIGNVMGDAEVETSGGDIEIRNIKGKLNASTSGGDIEVKNVDGDTSLETAGGDLSVGIIGGNLEAKTAGGDILAEGVHGRTDAQTAGGDIELGKLGGSFDAVTVGGDISVGLTGSYPGKMNTLGGDLVLFLPASAQVSIEAKIELSRDDEDGKDPITSEFGEITVKRGSVLKSVSSDFDINGGGPVIEIQNLNGTISVRKNP